jgi:hypothetical protein
VSGPVPIIDLSFPHAWQAEILPSRPAILPARRYVYPRDVEEIERGALEVLVRADVREGTGFTPYVTDPEHQGASAPVLEGTGFSPYISQPQKEGALAPVGNTESLIPPQPFLATCAVGFLDPIVPTGIWSCPNPREICAVSGGYAYIIDSAAPERFTRIAFLPVLEVRPAVENELLLFVGHYSILAWGKDGQAWQSEKLSDEGITITGIESGVLRGLGWKMMTDKETPFSLDLTSGNRIR